MDEMIISGNTWENDCCIKNENPDVWKEEKEEETRI